jgi:hypothetical protein
MEAVLNPRPSGTPHGMLMLRHERPLFLFEWLLTGDLFKRLIVDVYPFGEPLGCDAMCSISIGITSAPGPYGKGDIGQLWSKPRIICSKDGERQSAYRALAKAPLNAQIMEEIRARTNKGWALGSGRFQSKVARLTERRTAPLPRGRPKSSG